MSDKTTTEGEMIAKLERLLDSLPDDAARQRVLEWATQRWGRRPEAAKTLPITPTVNPPAWVPPPTWPMMDASTRGCAFDGLPDGVYGLVCFCPKCSPRCTMVPSGVNTTLFDDQQIYGPGATLPSGVYRS